MFFRHLLQTFFIVFLYHFLPVLYTVKNYPNTWFTRSYLAQSAHKSNTIYNKIKNTWFPFPIYSVLQLPKQCLRKNVGLLNFCLCVYITIHYLYNRDSILKYVQVLSFHVYLYTASHKVFWKDGIFQIASKLYLIQLFCHHSKFQTAAKLDVPCCWK